MFRYLFIAILIFIAGCAQIPPTPQEIQAKTFESVPGKAVIYIVRGNPDMYFGHGSFALDDKIVITMMQGNFYLWEVAPGPHHIVGRAQDMSRVTINAEAGKVYFVQHTVFGSRGSTTGGNMQLMPEREGRAMVQRATLVGGG
jgi:uncharacterized protein DUF2846